MYWFENVPYSGCFIFLEAEVDQLSTVFDLASCTAGATAAS